MDVDEREATDSGSLSGNPDLDSPSTGGDSFGRCDAGVPRVLNTNTPAVAAGGGILGGGGGSDARRGRGNGDSSMGKKKRGRPRKYDADGNLHPSYIKSPPVMIPTGFTLTTPPSYEIPAGPKRGRGRSQGSGNWQVLSCLGDLFASTAGGNFTPHLITVEAGEDIAGKILSFAQKGHQGVCVLSATGPVSNVTLRQPGSSGGLLTYEGRFEILTLTGSYTVSENGGIKSRSGGLSVSLASLDGRVIGGGVAGMLTAASPTQVVVGSFVPNGFEILKRKAATDRGVSPAEPRPMVAVTAATPISLAPPENCSGAIHNLGIGNHNLPNTGSIDGNGSGAGSGPPVSVLWRQSPDINIPMPAED